jgi:hypothetical protein
MSEILKPRATVEWPLSSTSGSSVTLAVAVGTHPVAEVTLYEGSEAGEKSNRALSSSFARALGRVQALGYRTRTSPDTKILLEDGRGGNLEFGGFVNSPSTLLARDNLVPSVAVVASAAAVANLDLGIYNLSDGRGNADDPLKSASLSVSRKVTDKDLALRLKTLTEETIKFWINNRDRQSASPLVQRLTETRHQANTHPLSLWYALLDNSNLGESDWLSVLEGLHRPNRALNASILSVLRAPASSFENVIDTLTREYQMMYVPALDGSIGRFEWEDASIEGDAQELRVSASSLLFNGDTSGDLMPVQQVIIRGMMRDGTLVANRLQEGKFQDGGVLLGGFPDLSTAPTGNIQSLTLPGYLQLAFDNLRPSRRPGTARTSIRGLPAEFQRVSDFTRRYISDVGEKMINNYARNAFIRMALGNSSVTVETPCDLSLVPGRRYSVSASDGPLFTGFLYGLRHHFQMDPGQGAANTQLNFTHVRFPGFQIPGL